MLINYIQIHILVIVFLSAFLLSTAHLYKTESIKSDSYGYLIWLFIAAITAEIVSCAWAILDYNWQSYHILLDVCNVVRYICSAAICLFWLYYQCAFGRGKLCSTTMRRFLLAIPYLLFAVTVVLSPWMHTVFHTDVAGKYRLDHCWIYIAIQIFYFLWAFLSSLYRYMHAGSYIEEKLNVILMSMPGIFLLFLLSQLLFFRFDFMCIAIIVSMGFFYFIKSRNRIVDIINDDFLAVFIVNVDKLSMKTVLISDEYIKMVYCPLNSEFSYDNAIEGVRNHVVEEDRYIIEKEFDPEYIYLKLSSGSSYSIVYRINTISNEVVFFQSKFVPVDNDDGKRLFLLCVKDIKNGVENDKVLGRYYLERADLAKKRELFDIISYISKDYEAISKVNLKSGEMSFYQQSLYFKDELAKVPFDKRGYKDCFHLFVKKHVIPEDQRRYLKKMNIVNLTNELKKRKVVVVRFRLIGATAVMWCETRIIRNDDDDTKVLMTIRNIDEELKQEIAYRREKVNREIYDVIEGLSQDFSCVLLVDPVTWENSTFSRSEKYQKYIDEWEGSCDFLTRLKLLNNKYVYEDDRENFAKATKKDVIMNYLKNHKVYFVNYRSVIENKIENWQMKFIMVKSKDAQKLVVGFHNIDNEITLEAQRYAVVAELTKDFMFVDYVHVSDNKDVNGTIERYQIDKDFLVSIPDWDKKRFLQEKLLLLRDHFVVEDDREGFFENAVDFEKIKEIVRESTSFAYPFRALINGKKTHCQIRFIAYYGKGSDVMKGMIVGVRSIENEVSKELKHVAELEKARMAAEDASRSKSMFLFNMSHDMRTPMNAILGFAELAKNADGDMDKINDYLDNIGIAGEHLLNLINDILDMARIEHGKVSIIESEIDIASNADDLYSIVKKTAESKRIDFSVDHKGVKNRRVIVDKMHLNQIVLNLISNAIKYTPDGGKVSYRITEAPSDKAGYAVYDMTVSDNGVGMDAKFLATIFEPFARSDGAAKSGIQGTGLGMTITKHLIEQMNGSIKIESEVGKGTEVKVSFNLRLAEQKKNIAKEAVGNVAGNSGMNSLRGKKVLLVDDNKLNQKLASAILNIGKLVVETASNGCEALEKVKSHEPSYYDFILMDVQMPQMDGYETTKAIRGLTNGDYSTVPIVAMTANACEEDKIKAFAAGMNSHVAKPIDVKILFSVLCGLLKDKNEND